MCGIAGIACKTGAIPAAVIQAMTKMLRHRGPDDEGYVWLRTLEAPAEIAGGPETPAAVWHSPSAFAPEKTIEEAKNSAAQVVLGHRRLAILDLTSSGHQPMCDPTARYWIVHNGEIYNFQEIRQRLRARDSQFVSDTDTEVVLYAYQAWGKECLDQFNGMWAFAILDRPQNELFLARDRFGVKPLYYVFNGRYFAFASEIKALAASGIFERRAEEAQLLHFLATGLTDHAEQTLFAGIRRLPAGHWLRLNLRRWELDIKPYYELPARLAPLVAPCAEEEEETARMLLALLADSVALRLTSDVPVGTCLSGGLDSSSLACLMHRLNSRAPRCPDYQRTFSAVYGSHQYDESHYIEQVVRSIRSNHFYTTVTRADFSRDLLRFVWHQEEPFDKLGVYAQWQVYKLVRESGVKVTLDGQGGDELFAGYEVYFSDYYQSLLSQRRYGDWLRELLGFACHHGPLEAKTFLPSWRRLLRRALYGAIPPSQRAPEADPDKPSFNWLSRDFWAAYRLPPTLRDAPNGNFQGLTRRLFRSLVEESIPPAVRLADKNAMAHSVESRLPFLDYRLVEFAFSLPDALKIRSGQTKYILRLGMRGVLPEAVRRRQDKVGFYLLLPEWFRQEPLRSFVWDVVRSSSLRQRPYFDPEGCRREFERFLKGGPYQQLWRWLNAELWLRQYVDHPPQLSA